MFKGLTNLASLVKQAQQVGSRIQAVNDELRGRRCTGKAGGGMVEAEVDGLGQVLRISIDPALVECGLDEPALAQPEVPFAGQQAVTENSPGHLQRPAFLEIRVVPGQDVFDVVGVAQDTAAHIHKTNGDHVAILPRPAREGAQRVALKLR